MTTSRFYARPKFYTTGAGDPRGYVGATAEERTAFRYQMPFGQWGSVAFVNDPVRYNGRPYVTDALMIPAAGIPDGTLVEVIDGFGGRDIYEFRSDGGPATPPNLLVALNPADTDVQVATAFENAVNGIGTTNHITASIPAGPGNTVRLTQDSNFFGGRTGFYPGVLAGSGGVISSQTLPAVFLVTEPQRGYDPLDVVPGWVGPRPVLLGINAKPVFLVT